MKSLSLLAKLSETNNSFLMMKQHGVTMIHPGYGFLSENAEFARKVEEAGILFIGPQPQVIDGLGDKIKARKLGE